MNQRLEDTEWIRNMEGRVMEIKQNSKKKKNNNGVH